MCIRDSTTMYLITSIPHLLTMFNTFSVPLVIMWVTPITPYWSLWPKNNIILYVIVLKKPFSTGGWTHQITSAENMLKPPTHLLLWCYLFMSHLQTTLNHPTILIQNIYEPLLYNMYRGSLLFSSLTSEFISITI